MKRFIKIVTPILLIAVILTSIGWYLLKYDPELTKDLLVSQARQAEDRGDHSFATWLYKMAYQRSGNDETIAIELAEQYRTVGNYTKAEYTLSNAIADGGSVELYLALCRTYVEQDKLLDAVTMLDNVSDPEIVRQLEAIRPAAPVATPDAGYYNKYTNVELTAPEGTIYVTTDGRYPTTKDAPYSGPISLSGGETKICALTMSQNGLVSPLTVLGYTVAGVIEEVSLADPAIDQAVRELLQVGEDHVLWSSELWSITKLTIPAEAGSLEDLRWMPFLTSLEIRDHEGFGSLSALSGLADLQELTLENIPVSYEDLSTIAALPDLTSLILRDCSVAVIDPLAQCGKLSHLDLRNNTIHEIDALSQLTDLEWLDLSHNVVDDLTPLGDLRKLSQLYASYNTVRSTAPLSGCTSLMWLDLERNSLTGLDGLSQLPGLRTLHVGSNQINEITALAGATVLTDLDLSNNRLQNIDTLASLPVLTTLNFSHNEVSELPAFSASSPLVNINGSHNSLSSLEGLRGLSALNYVNMDNNSAISSISPLTKCPVLVEVSVYGTGITDVSALTDKNSNVIVKYTPI